jgi:hypothetical protein
MKITIDTHYCSREELQELKDYLEENCWDFKTDEKEVVEGKYMLIDYNKIHVIGSNGVTLSDSIFDEELHEYRIIDRETEIDSLYQWISEARDETTKQMMKNDLAQLQGVKDDFVLSSGKTNNYVSREDSNFNELVEQLLELNNNLPESMK